MRPLQSIPIAILLTLAGCAPSGPGAKSDFVYSYMDRYPLTAQPVVRVEVSGYRPQSGDVQIVQSTARQFLRTGQGKIIIFVPQSGSAALSSGHWVKQELVAAGVPPSRIQWDARPLPNGTIRIAFGGSNTQSAWNCTNLLEDVQQRADETSHLNREMVNFGCAFQSNVRAQVDNPSDFVKPRLETGIDPVRTANAVNQLRTKQATPSASPSPQSSP